MAQALQICNGPERAFGHWASLLRHVLPTSMKSVEYCMDVLHYYRLVMNFELSRSLFRHCLSSGCRPCRMYMTDLSTDTALAGRYVAWHAIVGFASTGRPLKHEGDFDHEF